MDTLFGVPTERLMWILLAVFGAGALILVVLALRNRVAFKMAARNIPRRKTQSVLIVAGLMLATLLFSASFTTGDTLTNSIRTQALEQIGQTDVVVKKDAPESGGQFAGSQQEPYFDQSVAGEVRNRLSGDEEVAGVAPLATETVPVLSSKTKLSEPAVDVLGIDGNRMQGFDRLTKKSGSTLSVGDLGKGEVYVSNETADGLNVKTSGKIEAFLGQRPTELTVAGIYERGANPGSETSMVMPLDRLQNLTGNAGKVNNVIVTHTGPAVEGGAPTQATVDELKPLLASNNLQSDPVKKDALEQADETGQQFSNIFLLFGQFSVAVGILLIFLIFVMLAAERKRELGIARGIGMRRGHLVRMFTFEGTLYALVASAVGSVLGVGVGWAMVQFISRAFNQFDDFGLKIAFAFSPENVVIAFTMGMVLTFLIVLFSAVRVSRMNVVRAIRDIPEPDKKGRSVRGVLLAILTPLAGALAIWQGLAAGQAGLYLFGISLVVIGVALLLRIFRVPDRVAFTLAGLALVGLWVSPFDLGTTGMAQGIDLFFISGIMIVIGGVWVVIYNSDLLLGAVVAIFGRIKGLPPVLKTAVSYPMQSRFRTGMILALFSLVIFSLVTMGFINKSISSIFDDTSRISGGFEVRADAGYAAPIPDMQKALQNTSGVNPDDIAAVGSVSGLPVKAKQRDTDREPKDLLVQGVSAGYAKNVGYGFKTTAAEYGSKKAVWNTLEKNPNTAVISSALAPTRSNLTFGGPEPPVKLSGFYQEDKALPDDLFIQVKDPSSGETKDLRVIGVLQDTAFYAGNVMTSSETLEGLTGGPVPAQSYYFDLAAGANAGAVATNLEEGFAQNGLQAAVLKKEIEDQASANTIINDLLTGFMGLGLLVGIAALGVIAARSVVERRQQIGMLRALGFQKGQVRLVFLLESSFLALLGIGLGVALGAALSNQVISGLTEDLAGATYQVPWALLGIVVTLSYVASLLTTYLPARQASKVYPAEALRYEE
ncbi:MAG: FtsX-like permease family protein [Rubrobacteraceae bacterium]